MKTLEFVMWYMASGLCWSVLVICATILQLNNHTVWHLWVLVVMWAFFGFPSYSRIF